MSFNMFFTAVLRVAVKRFSAYANVGKDMVCTKVRGEKGEGGMRGRPEKGRDKPQETVAEPQAIWGMLYADDAGIVVRSRNSLAKMMVDIFALACMRIMVLFIKDSRRKNNDIRKPSGTRIIGDIKKLNIGLLSWGEKRLAGAAALAGPNGQNRSRASSSTYLKRPAAAAAAAASCRSSKQQQAPTGRSVIYLALLDTRCASNAASTRRSPSFFFAVLSAPKGVVAARRSGGS